MSARFLTLAWRNDASPPAATISSVVAWPASALRFTTSTLAPSFANTAAMPLPMPRPAPVTIAAFPCNVIAMLSSRRLRADDSTERRAETRARARDALRAFLALGRTASRGP